MPQCKQVYIRCVCAYVRACMYVHMRAYIHVNDLFMLIIYVCTEEPIICSVAKSVHTSNHCVYELYTLCFKCT